jgi:hypothetical protein
MMGRFSGPILSIHDANCLIAFSVLGLITRRVICAGKKGNASMFHAVAVEAARSPEPTVACAPVGLGLAGTAYEPLAQSSPEIWQGSVRIAIADQPALVDQAARLVHDVYVRCGYVRPNPQGRHVTRFDELAETVKFVACLGETVIATLTLVPDGRLGLPMESIYHDELQLLRDQGRRLAEVTSLADRRKDPKRGMMVFLGLTRLMIQTARARQIDDLLVAVHPKHVRFYQRVLAFERFGPERAYPMVEYNPAVPLRLDLKDVKSNEQLSRRVLSRYFGSEIDCESAALA